MSLGSTIKELRVTKKWTQEQLADEIGKITGTTPTKSNVAQWEHDRISPSPDRIKAIAKLSNTDMTTFVADKTNSNEALVRIEQKLDFIIEQLKNKS